MKEEFQSYMSEVKADSGMRDVNGYRYEDYSNKL